MARVPKSLLVVTMLLATNAILAALRGSLWVVQAITLAGPMLIVWMVVDVLRDRATPVRDLDPDEEWGYQDRPDIRPTATRRGALPGVEGAVSRRAERAV